MAEANTTMQYEIGVLYHPGLEVDLTKAEDKVTKIFTANGGKVTATDNWGKKKLLYPIKGNDHAVYVFYTVDLPNEGVSKVETTLNITDEVIRYLIVRQDEKELAKLAEAKALKEKLEKSRDNRDDKENTDEAN
jgi:small subunit ribosomal protein S6